MKARLAIAALLLLCASVVAWKLYSSSAPESAQIEQAADATPVVSAPQAAAPATTDNYKDTSMLKPPAGASVAIFEFEDMECPLCAHDFSLVRAASQQHNVPLVRHDYPLIEIHQWAFDAAVTARYIQDNLSPALAEDFRHDVFANQPTINSKDDLVHFTGKWFAAHNHALPFVFDANGTCKQEVLADRALGDRIGIHHTPCLFVVTQTGWTEVMDITQLDSTIESALADTRKRAA
jgi:protein-disulfide isomerase